MDDWVIYVVDKPEPVAVPVMDKRPESRPWRHATSGIAVTPPRQSFPRRFI